MLYRLADPADWQQARQTGFFASADLAAEGFIHTSERAQLLETARRHYAGRPELWLLEIDEAVLTASDVRVEREWAARRQEFFAHVFAPMPLAAIRRSWPVATDAAGTLALPAELAG